jgi:hypothetical protein
MRQHLADALEFLADFHTLSKLKVCNNNNSWTIVRHVKSGMLRLSIFAHRELYVFIMAPPVELIWFESQLQTTCLKVIFCGREPNMGYTVKEVITLEILGFWTLSIVRIFPK